MSVSPAFAGKSEGGPILKNPPAGLCGLGQANFDFPQNTFFSNFKLREIVFMGFLTYRNLPETLGGHIQKSRIVRFFDFFCMPGFFTFFKISGLL